MTNTKSRKLTSVIAILLVVIVCFTFCGCSTLGVKLTISAEYVGKGVVVGEDIIKNDIVVKVSRSNSLAGYSSEYKTSNFAVSGFDSSTVGAKTVTITYVESGLTAKTTVDIPVVEKPAPIAIGITATYNGENLQIGDIVDKENFTVIVAYSDDSRKPTTDFTIGEVDTSTHGDKLVTVTYVANGEEYKTSVKVTVEAPPVVLMGISALYNGGPLQQNEPFDTTLISVVENYSDGSTKPVTSFTCSQVVTSQVGTQTVTVSYQKDGKTHTDTFDIIIVEAPVTLESISATFVKQKFYVGETLSTQDFTVTATYSNGHVEETGNFTIVGNTTFATAGTHTVQISFSYEDGEPKTCNVTITVLENPTLSKIEATFNKTAFYIGETLTNADFTVTATLTDGSTFDVSDFVITGEKTFEEAGEKQVVISYELDDITRTCEVKITVAEDEKPNYGTYGVLSSDGKSVKIVDTAKVSSSDQLQIHFLELGHYSTGDSVYIKAGDTDILIDAGSIQSSSKTIANYVNNYCKDGKLEYVIATHAHKDHIAGFVGTTTKGEESLFEQFNCGTIIDFPKSDQSLTTSSGNDSLYAKYLAKRNAAIDDDTVHYSALECYNADNSATRFSQSVNEKSARRYIKLAENIEMEILYNYYYDHDASNENDYSVCVMIHHYGRDYDFANLNNPNNENNVNHFLLTGDLEEAGEERLAGNYDLPKCVLFKGGHHGSYTATSEVLLKEIQPKVVCICCCTGSPEYASTNPPHQFPAQEMMARVSAYTDMVFATSKYNASLESKFESLNGAITVTSSTQGVHLTATNNITLLKDTAWFTSWYDKWAPDMKYIGGN